MAGESSDSNMRFKHSTQPVSPLGHLKMEDKRQPQAARIPEFGRRNKSLKT